MKIGIIRNKLATGQRYHGDNGRAFGSCNQADSGPAVHRSFGYSRIVPANDCPSRFAFPESLCDQVRPCESSVLNVSNGFSSVDQRSEIKESEGKKEQEPDDRSRL